MKNIVGEIRKFQVGSIGWSIEVIELRIESALVKLTLTSPKETVEHIQEWSKGELESHGFDLG